MNRLVAAGILALIVLLGGVAMFIAGSKPQLSVYVKCSPYTTVSPYQGWVERCRYVTRTVTFLNTTKYFEVKVCENIPTAFHETLTFQECYTTTKTWTNVWIQVGGVIFLCLGLGFLLTTIVLLVAFRRKR